MSDFKKSTQRTRRTKDLVFITQSFAKIASFYDDKDAALKTLNDNLNLIKRTYGIERLLSEQEAMYQRRISSRTIHTLISLEITIDAMNRAGTLDPIYHRNQRSKNHYHNGRYRGSS